MDIVSIILMSIALAMDCFSVAVTQGMYCRSWQSRVWLMAALFGLFQGAMPLIGYSIGMLFAEMVARYAPWIALILLGYIGTKMILESLRKDEGDVAEKNDWSFVHLILLAIATSIDALATGVIFVAQPERIWLAVSVIALGSFLFTLLGYGLGAYVGKRLRFNAELVGGIILVLIGIKICVEGLCS